MEPNKYDNDTDLELELPTAPKLPLGFHRPAHFTRKRTWDKENALINDSSDPAVFSSDDHQAGSLEDYASKKRKKHHWQGTWWGERAQRLSSSSGSRQQIRTAKPARAQRQFRRNYDSGIYMGSEGTESSIDEEFLEDFRKKEAAIGEENNNHGEHEGVGGKIGSLAPPQGSASSSQESRTEVHSTVYSRDAQAIIERCLEDGNETIDLS